MRTQTCHFWVGAFPEPQRVADYFAEVWNEEDEARDFTPLSAFANDQGEKWYDHDFLEYGYQQDSATIQELVAGYSYSDQWADELSRRVEAIGLTGINMFVFIDVEQVERPVSVNTNGYTLHYMGTIEYRI